MSANYGGGGRRWSSSWPNAGTPTKRANRWSGWSARPVIARLAPDRSWVLAETAQGVTFAWTREAYSFSATSAKGLGAADALLWAFPLLTDQRRQRFTERANRRLLIEYRI